MRMVATARHSSLAAVCIAVTGCGEDGGASGAAVVVRDSAGVTIVENPALGAQADLGWGVGPGPSFDIGALEGPDAYQLFRVRDALRLPDGRVAVLDGGSAEVRVFGPDGSHLATWGGQGEGPGEFMQPTALASWPGDSLAVWDNRLRRLTVMDPHGALGRALTIAAAEGMEAPAFSHVLDDGRLVVVSPSLLGSEPWNGLRRIPVRVAVLHPDGTLAADLGEHPGQETFMRVGEGSIEIMRLTFARGYAVSGAGDETLIAPNDRLELRYWDATGALTRVVRIARPPRLVTEADRAAELERRLTGAPEQARPGIRRAFEEFPGPDTLPAFSEAGTDTQGYTWVRPFRTAADTGRERWIVLDPEGVALGTVELPEGIDVYEIGADYVLGRWADELGVEHVRMWPLTGR